MITLILVLRYQSEDRSKTRSYALDESGMFMFILLGPWPPSLFCCVIHGGLTSSGVPTRANDPRKSNMTGSPVPSPLSAFSAGDMCLEPSS